MSAYVVAVAFAGQRRLALPGLRISPDDVLIDMDAPFHLFRLIPAARNETFLPVEAQAGSLQPGLNPVQVRKS